MPQLILLSANPADRALAEGIVAAGSGWGLAAPDSLPLLKAHLAAPDSAFVLFDASDPASAGLVWDEARKAISTRLPPHRVVAMSDDSFGADQQTFGGEAFFSHFWMRPRAGRAPGTALALELAEASFRPPAQIASFFKETAAHQEIVLRAASHRVAATQAVQSFFEKLGVSGRLAARLAVAADELASNAIFTAPDTAERRAMDRAGEFALPGSERIRLGVYRDDAWSCLYVVDSYGTFRLDTLFRIFAKNFREVEYAPQGNRPSAGIGLRGLMDQGLSLVYLVAPKRQTVAAAFFPSDASIKTLKESPQFISYLPR